MQCERSECESPETGLMRFGAMRISVNEPLATFSPTSLFRQIQNPVGFTHNCKAVYG